MAAVAHRFLVLQFRHPGSLALLSLTPLPGFVLPLSGLRCLQPLFAWPFFRWSLLWEQIYFSFGFELQSCFWVHLRGCRLVNFSQICVFLGEEMLTCENGNEQVVESLRAGDLFGEIGVLYDKPQHLTVRTKKLSQLLRLSGSVLLDKMQTRPTEAKVILRNFLQHFNGSKQLGIENWSNEYLLSHFTTLTANVPKTLSNISWSNLQPRSISEAPPLRVIIYKNHPSKNKQYTGLGKLVILPDTLDQLLKMAGLKFGFHPVKVLNEDGAEIDEINVIRDNDPLFLVDKEELEELYHTK